MNKIPEDAISGKGRGRLAEMFSRKKGAAFMPYVCCGDPSEEFTLELVKALVKNGADAIEFGIPFSDPIADGKAIQGASQRALAAGMTPKKAIAAVARLRKDGVAVPIIAMTYCNIAEAAGVENFVCSLAQAGADGLIVPDAPLEESEELRKECTKAGIEMVLLIAPNCGDERIGRIAEKAGGFLYAVSVLGTTGAREKVAVEAVELVKRAKKASKLPVCVGFGISKPEHAAELAAAGADGIIVGSEIVNLYAAHMKEGKPGEKAALAEISEYAAKMKAACLQL